jgi:hypothetical protein
MRYTLALMLVGGAIAACGGRTQTGWYVGDGGPHVEAGRKDGNPSCFGGQATSYFAGTYTGPWSGTWSCWSGVTLGGTLALTLTATASGLSASGTIESFTQLPSVNGTIDGVVACSGSSPVMTGTIPRVSLTGSGVAYNLKGTLSATYVPTVGLAPRFTGGSWTVTASDGSGCTGSGTWSATK